MASSDAPDRSMCVASECRNRCPPRQPAVSTPARANSGPVWSGYLGLILYGSTALSIGLLASSLTNNQIVSLVVGLGILLVLTLIEQASRLLDGVWATLLSQIGLTTHLEDFYRGVIDTTHIVYYITFTMVFLFLTVRSLETRRWR